LKQPHPRDFPEETLGHNEVRPGAPMTLGNAAAAGVRLIVWGLDR
jgi:hypothetical protein